MAAGAGKVALLNTTTALTGACPSSASIIDLVGYGTTANCFEGAGPAPAPSATTADIRAGNGCTDNNNNAADFSTGAPNPRNTASPLNNCSAQPAPTLSINDVTAAEGNSGTTTFTFTLSLSAAAPAGGVTFDIATQDGTATVADNDYVARSLTSQTIAAGSQTYTFDVTVNGDTKVEPDETFLVNVTNVTGATLADGQGQGTIQNDDVAVVPALSINDVTANEGNAGTTTFTFTVSLSSPAPAGGVTFNIATQDNTATVADNDYVARSLTAQTIPAGQQTYTFDVTVNGDTTAEANETFFVNVTSVSGATISDGQGTGTITNDDVAATPLVVISQVYGGGGNAGAQFRNDFIEIFNRGTTAVNLSGWSVQYVAATGTGAWSVTNLSGTLQPGQYYLIQEATGGANGNLLPTPDASGTIAMAAGAGKVALLNTTTALTGACPSSASIIDLVGYGTTANCFEGAGPAPAPSNTTADIRAGNGCTDNNNNAADFSTGVPNPRNTASPTNSCGGAIAPPQEFLRFTWDNWLSP
jgi:predicted secreted protein